MTRSVFWFRGIGLDSVRKCNLRLRRRHDFGTAKVALSITRSHAPFEVAIGSGDADFTRFEQPRTQSDAGTASRWQGLRPSRRQRAPDAALLRFLLY